MPRLLSRAAFVTLVISAVWLVDLAAEQEGIGRQASYLFATCVIDQFNITDVSYQRFLFIFISPVLGLATLSIVLIGITSPLNPVFSCFNAMLAEGAFVIVLRIAGLYPADRGAWYAGFAMAGVGLCLLLVRLLMAKLAALRRSATAVAIEPPIGARLQLSVSLGFLRKWWSRGGSNP